ncbi:hypothetical protein NB636_07080 [Oxalobacter aliiformigenes]|uniref:hypothetical protein n=1 Tax=Oxalobacter aliiformigenes TaxID=2946593 RepID=UPI0022B03860|nr:hypothetical protein [Oxalobacter aliiformigenes]MCZ4063859.1 hypothetical protein [Oxalobacter aliiformigenes]WAV98485.1 hypothetical protein NB636_07080 [Oxalobacter aliiformigenes]
MALSLLSFSLADVRDGLGPFLGVYLQGKNWTPDEIGYVMTVGGLAHRLGQNEAWNHFGNFSTAVLGGLAGYYYGIPGVFGVMLVMGLCSVAFVFMIDPGLIDYDTARGLEKEKMRFRLRLAVCLQTVPLS